MRDIKTLQADIHKLVGELQTHVASGAPGPSFAADAIPIFPLPPQLEDTRQDALEALEELAALLRGPIPYLMDLTGPRVTPSQYLPTLQTRLTLNRSSSTPPSTPSDASASPKSSHWMK